MDTLMGIYNNKTVTVKKGKKVLDTFDAEELNGDVDQKLENLGYARMTAWNTTGKYKRARLLRKS